MVYTPTRFKRVAAAYDDVAMVVSCECSSSYHSLSALVNSFFEKEIREQREKDVHIETNEDDDESESNGSSPDLVLQDSLKKLFDCGNDAIKQSIYADVEKALGELGRKSSSPDIKRLLIARLRDRGVDAGLCESMWEKVGRCPCGAYEYIDVNANETRYIIEVSLASHFTIARPTPSYASLLEIIPSIYVGKPDELKNMVSLMCNAIRKSMKSMEIDVAPWRRPTYMQAKWFSCYKRTTDDVLTRKALKFDADLIQYRAVGFVPVSDCYCQKKYLKVPVFSNNIS